MSVLSQSHIPYELIALIIQNLLSYVYMMCTLYTYYVQQTMFCFDNCPATTTWKYIVVDTILFLNTTYFVWKKYLPQKKKINYSKSAYRLLTTWICIENLFSSCYMPSVDISTIKIRSYIFFAFKQKKINFCNLNTFPYLLKIFKSCPSLGN